MEFGFQLPHFLHVASPGALQQVSRHAEELGYESIWVADHIAHPVANRDRFGDVWYEPLTTLAYVAAFTSRIKLGTNLIVAPYRNPVVLAKVVSTIDALSEGRVIYGIGAGHSQGEFRALGVPFEERGQRTDEALRIMRAVYAGDNVPHYESERYQITDVVFGPQPVQRPHPPIWVGGNSPRGRRRAVEFGDAWHPSRPTPEAVADGIAHLKKLGDRLGRDVSGMTIAARMPLRFYDSSTAPKEPRFLMGTLDHIIATVQRYQEAGVQHFVLDTFYSMPELHDQYVPDIMRTMERFANEVRPKVASR